MNSITNARRSTIPAVAPRRSLRGNPPLRTAIPPFNTDVDELPPRIILDAVL
jgi:hypothetical protein